jgi:hypothetical protein
VEVVKVVKAVTGAVVEIIKEDGLVDNLLKPLLPILQQLQLRPPTWSQKLLVRHMSHPLLLRL